MQVSTENLLYAYPSSVQLASQSCFSNKYYDVLNLFQRDHILREM